MEGFDAFKKDALLESKIFDPKGGINAGADIAEKLPVPEILPPVQFNSEHWWDYFNSDKLETTQKYFVQFAQNVAWDQSNRFLKSVLKQMFPEVDLEETPELVTEYKELISNYGKGFKKQLEIDKGEENFEVVKRNIVNLLEIAQKYQKPPIPLK
jgi:hypothetical protein